MAPTDSQIENWFFNENYPSLIAYYENQIEGQSINIHHYWGLGLVYLLQGQEELAQLTWLVALEHIEETDSSSGVDILVDFLNIEADRQETYSHIHSAWLIRRYVQEFQPDNLINLMKLLGLEAQQNYAFIETMKQSQIIALLSSSSSGVLPTSLIVQTLEKVLYFADEENVNFARACLAYSANASEVSECIAKIAKKVNIQANLVEYPVSLLNLCLDQNPDNLALLRSIHLIWSDKIEHYDQARQVAQIFLGKSQTISTKAFALRQLIYLYERHYNWQDVLAITQDYFEAISQFFQSKLNVEGFIESVLPLIPQHIFHLADDPQIHRRILNQFSLNFEKITTRLGAVGCQYTDYPNALVVNRPLRLGYIGHTFRKHSVGWLCRWLIYHHDRENFQIYIYSLNPKNDDLTEHWFIQNSNHFYRYTTDELYENIVQQIRDDQIDILVDLDSLTLITTCEVLVHKPAPIQITWLGLDGSGIPAIDYFMADPYVLPDDAQDYYTERIWRLPHSYLGIDGFEIGTPTLTRASLKIDDQAVIFMNSQGPLKLHPDILRLQLQIIKKVPNSYLLLKGNEDHRFLCDLVKNLAIEVGVDGDRLRFIGKTATELEHRANLGMADVILDTYPYNGATTTLESLWMEIPIITRVGEQFAARNSYTFMINAGITEGIARTGEEYIEWGIKLGTEENLRKEISWKLRQSKKTSPLWNGKQFAREMENAYRKMWETYVAMTQK